MRRLTEAGRVNYQLSTIGTKPSAPPSLCSWMEPHHPIMIMIWGHGGKLDRDTSKHIYYYNTEDQILVYDHQI